LDGLVEASATASTTLRTPTYRILLLTQDLKLAGAQRQLVELARGLAAAGHDVRVGVLEPGGPLTADITGAGIALSAFRRRWRWDLLPVVSLASYLRRERIDVIHSFLFLPSFYSRFAGRLARVPAIISSLRGSRIEGHLRYRLDVATSSLCHAITANSAAGRDDYVEHGGAREKIVVIRNGLDSSRLCATPVHADRVHWKLDRFDLLIGMVGTMEDLRDHRLLVTAMEQIVRRKSGVGLVLVGDGTLRPEIEALVQHLGISQHVVLTGTLRHPERIYPLLAVYVQASATEGISNSILEAMFCALPVVATDVGGNPETVVHGRTGTIVPPGDPAAMADAVVALLDDPARRREMGREAQQRARTSFGLKGMLQATQELYDTLLESKRGGRHRSQLHLPAESAD
jgi:glycosyltransferase involved in cell wall biosynthesis